MPLAGRVQLTDLRGPGAARLRSCPSLCGRSPPWEAAVAVAARRPTSFLSGPTSNGNWRASSRTPVRASPYRIPSLYTVRFGADGTVEARADCNHCGGGYRVAGARHDDRSAGLHPRRLPAAVSGGPVHRCPDTRLELRPDAERAGSRIRRRNTSLPSWPSRASREGLAASGGRNRASASRRLRRPSQGMLRSGPGGVPRPPGANGTTERKRRVLTVTMPRDGGTRARRCRPAARAG